MTPSKPASLSPMQSLLRGTSYLTFVFVLRSAVGILSIGILARALTTAELGIFFVLTQLADVSSLFGRLGTAQSSQKFIPVAIAGNPGTLPSLSVRLFAVSAVGTAAVSLIMAGAWSLASTFILKTPHTENLLVPCLLMTAMLVLERLFSAYLRAVDQLFQSALTENFLRQLFFLAAITVFFFSDRTFLTLDNIFSLWIITSAASLLISAFWIARAVRSITRTVPAQASPITFRTILKTSLPLGLALITANFASSASVIVVSSLLGPQAAGTFGPLQRVAGVFIALLPMNKILMPIAATLHHGNRSEELEGVCRKGSSIIFALTVLGFAATAVLSFPMLPLVFGPKFEGTAGLLLLLVAGPVARSYYSPAPPVLQMAGQELLVMKVNLLTCIATFAGMYALSPLLGLYGIALATSLVMFLQFWMLGVYAKKQMGIDTQPDFTFLCSLVRNNRGRLLFWRKK